MPNFLTLVIALVVGLTLVGVLSDQCARRGDKNITPGLALLPGDLKYESPDGRVRLYFPIVTSIVLSVALSVVLRFLA